MPPVFVLFPTPDCGDLVVVLSVCAEAVYGDLTARFDDLLFRGFLDGCDPVLLFSSFVAPGYDAVLVGDLA